MSIVLVCFIALSMIYLLISLMSIFRLIKVMSGNTALKISFAFYAGMLITALSRSLTFYWITFQGISDSIILHLMFDAPDMLNICVYLLLVWYFLANFISSHINLANDMNIFLNNDKDYPSILKKTYILLNVIIPIIIVFFTVITILVYKDVLGSVLRVILTSSANVAMPLFFLGYYIFLIFKFSGRPYKSEKLRNQSKNILYIVLVWSGARMFVGIFMIVTNGFYMDIIISMIGKKDKNDEDSIWPCVAVIGFYLVTEFLPDFFALDYTFMMSYLKAENTTKLLLASSPDERLFRATGLKVAIDDNKNIEGDKQSMKSFYNSAEKKKNVSVNDFMIKATDFTILEQVFVKKNGFGVIQKGTFKNCEVVCRSVKFDRLSRYELEDFSHDFEEIIVLENPFIVPVVAVCVETVPVINIFYPYFKRKSLHDFLHIDKGSLDLKKRIELARKIAKGMEYLHENKIYHSHLCSRNILLEDDLTPKITDFGFKSLKENASIFLKYKNKSAYSPPELLKDKKRIGNCFAGLDYSIDVYSFGILLWEIYTMTIPFNVKLKTIYNMVAVENYRPEITKEFNSGVANIIRSCWDVDAKKRPTFSRICDLLATVKV